MVALKATAKVTQEYYAGWQFKTWATLRAAALARHGEENERRQAERDRLWRELVGKDTLSLRRLEREEMLRLIMLWLLGPDVGYANAPPWIEATVNQMLKSEIDFLGGAAPTAPSPSFAGIDGTQWSLAVLFGDLVKFVQQAVEWENLLYILYPYFWGGEVQGRDKMLFEHPDPEHQNFLRAGYCRLVITIRPGFEEAFTRFAETGSLGGTYTSPYLSIAEEIANHARTNYAGIPPANPERHARPLLYPQQRRTWASMERVIAAIEKHKLDNGDYPATLADLPAGLSIADAWGRPLVYTNPGSGNEYDLISLGSDNAEGGEGTAADISAAAGASLMASWFDYTPTSGIDIVVNTKPDVIA
jgi:Type II secretion system (T2SS), protein G